ncbi:MAG: nitrilase-related carbon-nitrogen hydrolase [Syntrophales bacterium]
MKAGFIQFEPTFGEIEQNIRRIEFLFTRVDAELIILPELCNTGYLFTSRGEAEEMGEEVPAGRTTEALCRVARARESYIVAGLIEKELDRLYNAAVLVGPDGYIATYRKIHLFSEETLWFDPGDREFAVYDIGICRVGMMICFDWIFPEAARVLSLKGADILCHPANLVLPFCQEAMVTRCLENRVYAITANRTGTEIRGNRSLHFTGKSQITGPDGMILSRAGAASEEVGVIDVDIDRSREKGINPYNDLLGGRRAEYYGALMNRQQR